MLSFFSSTSKSVKHFARTFNLVPAGSGVVIVNETLHVTLATKCQADVSLKYNFFFIFEVSLFRK